MTLLAILAVSLATTPPVIPPALPPMPVVGSQTVVATGVPVTRPATTPCSVALFVDHEFRGDTPLPIAYRPPAACPGPWAKVVFEGDFHVTAGEQFDRTGFVDIAGVNLFAGTTMEPRKALAPRWHVERDVTDYAALFTAAQDGQAQLTNYVDDRYNGRIFWTGRLLFYPAETPPATSSAPPARPAAAPDFIEALTPAPTRLTAKTPSFTRMVTFPRNIERLMIDILAQPQADDEFWWSCQSDPAPAPSPTSGTPPEPGCGRPFRDVEVLIDGRLAGFAAAYPWIYTGGVDPRMWTLTPSVEALDLPPTRVDLTPFAGVLTDGKPHAVTVRVAGVQRYFLAMGTLLGWRDPVRAVVTGGVDTNTLAPAIVTLTGRPAVGGDAERFGEGITSASRSGRVTGHIDTAHGRVTSTVDYRMTFRNTQRGADGGGSVNQRADVTTRRETRGPGGTRRWTVVETFPLDVEMSSRKVGADRVSDTHFRQGLTRVETFQGAGGPHRRTTTLQVEPRVHRTVPPTGPGDAKSQTTTITSTMIEDSRTGCIQRAVTVTDGQIVAVHDGCK